MMNIVTLDHQQDLNSSLKVGYDFSDITQQSVDMIDCLSKFLSLSTSSEYEMGQFHDQKDTYLCHSYAVLTALEFLLDDFITSQKNKKEEILRKAMKTRTKFNCSMAVFLGCISPRSFTVEKKIC